MGPGRKANRGGYLFDEIDTCKFVGFVTKKGEEGIFLHPLTTRRTELTGESLSAALRTNLLGAANLFVYGLVCLRRAERFSDEQRIRRCGAMNLEVLAILLVGLSSNWAVVGAVDVLLEELVVT